MSHSRSPAAIAMAFAATFVAVQPAPAQASPVVVRLDAFAVPAYLEAVASGLAPDGLAVFVVGTGPAAVPLGGGAVLGVSPDLIAGAATVGADGVASHGLPLLPELCAGATLLVQSVVLYPAGPVVATPVRAVEVPKRGATADVYVLFGQSNAEGYAPVAGLPSDLLLPMPRSRVWNIGTQRFEALAAGVNGRTVTTTAWCGPELSLLRSLSDADATTWLVKFAVGASSLGPSPGPWNEWDPEAGELYAALMTTLADATADLRNADLVPRVRGIAMMQGESDAADQGLATAYGPRLVRLVQRLRADIVAAGLAGSTFVPFAVGVISDRLTREVFPWTPAVRVAQWSVAASTPGCVAVETSTFDLQANVTHFSAAGVVALGDAFAAALRSFVRR